MRNLGNVNERYNCTTHPCSIGGRKKGKAKFEEGRFTCLLSEVLGRKAGGVPSDVGGNGKEKAFTRTGIW